MSKSLNVFEVGTKVANLTPGFAWPPGQAQNGSNSKIWCKHRKKDDSSVSNVGNDYNDNDDDNDHDDVDGL